ncbi:GNAT family N-acetyltransferase [Pendulispora brunnea]|uniref:GNAT family N-acetyltransferase n=1 Tax=Pendulispora brunnea TaxID=2905690 RepID=A0ABZ2JY11_9BACT
MKTIDEVSTPRLRLRRLRESDLEPFSAMNADPRVVEYLSTALSRTDSDALVARIGQHWDEHGFGLWAIEVPGEAPFIGFTGLARPRFHAHFTPCVEIGWRLAAEHWGRGYATEAARAALRVGFEVLGLPEIVSFTAVGNARSRRVMEKLGMRHEPRDDFDHPSLPEGHRLRRHVLYRLSATAAGASPSR